ncbi:NYN domain-containing protein [Chitinibacter tainanensis]|uniref:NYN domain-containing protein n=1 Tax=Chitinibacter tainanensis TaxID=230667 RepID=UPI0023534C48|nr:NYN domain-containing protein [Chitinibacter tainanensis]
MNYKFAVFIDGDNISPKLLNSIINEINKIGDIVLKRVYGDWTAQNMGSWKELLRETPIRTFQQFRHGEQATDGSMVMDAIELVASPNKNFNAFAIVSSDSDFYSLALRLREHGMYVLGVGRRQNTKAIFINSCNHFVYTDNLSEPTEAITEKDYSAATLISSAYMNSNFDEDGWLSLSALGSQIRKMDPAFSLQDYNCSTLLALVKSCESDFEVKPDTRTPPNYRVRKVAQSFSTRQTGTIKRIIGHYGFIDSDDGDYYFLRTNIIPDDRSKPIKVKDKVTFETSLKPKPQSTDPHEKNGKAVKVALSN